jgi:hypothetical protein
MARRRLLAGAGTRRLTDLEVIDAAPGYMNASTVSVFATVGDSKGAGQGVQVFITNFGPEQGASPDPWVPVARNVTLQLVGDGTPPKVSALMRRIDDETTTPLDTWVKQGSPTYPTPAQLDALHEASKPSEAWVELQSSDHHTVSINFEVPAYGVVHLSFDGTVAWRS